MIGQTWKSEIREFKDAKTGRTIQQLTTTGNNIHLYFTENSFDAHKNEIIFRSDRASGQDRLPHEDPCYNLFRMNLDTGEIVQLTDETRLDRAASPRRPTAASSSIRRATRSESSTPATGKITTIYEETGDYTLGSPSIARNRRYIAFCRNENVDVAARPELCRLQGSFLPGQRWAHHAGVSGWLGLVRRDQGHAPGRAFPVLPRRQHPRHVLPRRAVEPGHAAHLAARFCRARSQAVLPAGRARFGRARVLDAGRLHLFRRSRPRSRRHDHVRPDAGRGDGRARSTRTR